MSDEQLTAAEVERYHERGVVRISEAFARNVAMEVQDSFWEDAERRLGVRRDDPKTWQDGYWTGFSSMKHLVGRAEGPRLAVALDQLLGAGAWKYPNGWGGLLIGPPDLGPPAWTLTDRAWHWDGDPTGGASFFCLFSDTEPRSGGTLLIEGSGPLLSDWHRTTAPDPTRKARNLRKQFFAEHPFLRRLNGLDPVKNDPGDLLDVHIDEDGHRLQVTEVAGRAGDVIVVHSNIVHARPVHSGSMPRFLAFRSLDTAAPETS